MTARIRHRLAAASAMWVPVAALVLLAGVWSPAFAQEAPTEYYVEGGLDFSHFNNDYGNGNGQWLAFILSQRANYSLRFDVSHAARWGDEGYGGGLLAQKFIGRLMLGAGASGGGGRFIYPTYRVDASVGYGFLPEGNLQVILAYLHEQSKVENYYDRGSISANYYMNSHWIFGGFFNYDVGQPGDTVTKSIGLGATWYTWKKRYIGGLVSYGDVNY
ncbi:MAG: YaiO family outer membrane beta-barrel protein, partial [Candidatus Latescibacterota bacterium]